MNKPQRAALLTFGAIILCIETYKIAVNGAPEGMSWSISIFLGAVLIVCGLYKIEIGISRRLIKNIFLCVVLLIVSAAVALFAYSKFSKPQNIPEQKSSLSDSDMSETLAAMSIKSDCEKLFKKAISPEYKPTDISTEQPPLAFYSWSSDAKSGVSVGYKNTKHAIHKELEFKSFELKSQPDRGFYSPPSNNDGAYEHQLSGRVENKQGFIINFKSTCIGRLKSDKTYHVEIKNDVF